MNFYDELKENLINIKSDLLNILENREMIVRKKQDNDFQVYWQDNSEKSFLEVLSNFEYFLDTYENFQNNIGKEIIEQLSKSAERESKSLLNLFKKDIWHDPTVHSRYRNEKSSFYKTNRSEKTGDFFEEKDLEKAKNTMINNCRMELIKAFELKFEIAKLHLEKESKHIENIMQQTTKRKDKAIILFNYGLDALKTDSTVAMILLGVSIECQLKIKYNEDILEKDTLGNLIGKLKSSKKYPRINYKLLEEINLKYIKAKHETTSIIPFSEVNSFYQQALIFYN